MTVTYFFSYHNDEDKQQYYVVELEEELAIGQAELHIKWSGALVGTLVGINKVTYQDDSRIRFFFLNYFDF